MTKLIWLLIRAYQLLISPVIHLLAGPGYGCRHVPTCSEYAAQAVKAKGPVMGSWLALKRLGTCHPFARPSFVQVERGLHDGS